MESARGLNTDKKPVSVRLDNDMGRKEKLMQIQICCLCCCLQYNSSICCVGCVYINFVTFQFCENFWNIL